MPDVADQAWPLLLHQVCRRRAIEPVFQPIIDVARGVVCGYEALSRIREPDVLDGPQEWFAAARRHGFTGRLEATALQVILAHRPLLPSNCFLSLNASPEGLLDQNVVDVLIAEGDLGGVVIEITEHSAVEDYETLLIQVQRLRDRGAIIAVDDAGAGYASIRHLLALRPEVVKIDRSLVAGIDRDSSRAAAVSALGAFAAVLDAWIVAEGVEHLAELEQLAQLGVPLVQGYYLGRPTREMTGLTPQLAGRLRPHLPSRHASSLRSLALPALTVAEDPARVPEATVRIDIHDRPTHVFLPGGGRRATRHPAMCVQAGEQLPDIALRAAARRSEDRFSPVCLCDELGRLVGLIHIEKVLERLAHRAADR